MIVNKCLNCPKETPHDRHRRKARFCDKACARAWAAGLYRDANPAPTISSGKTGTISELLIAADLLRRGFDVFRAVSQSCSCDLAVLRDGKLYRIEVKTATRSISGHLHYPKKNIAADHVALVCGPAIEYHPPLPV